MTQVLYWDIDGTLLTTARGGVPALEDGVEAVTGRRPNLADMHTSGLTDRAIARQILVSMGFEADEETERAVLEQYGRALPDRLRQRRGQVLPGVRQLLDGLEGEDVLSLLLTGNVEAGARAKLESYDLLHYFSGGAFAEHGFDRVDIAREALAQAARLVGEAAAASGVIIGDTPLDVAAGAELGLRVVAVATGVYGFDVLAETGAWWVVERLPDAATLLTRISDGAAARAVGHVPGTA